MTASRQPHVLVLSRAYPTSALPTKGIWVERMARAASATARMTVVAPVPYAPPFLRGEAFARYRAVPPTVAGEFGLVHHPRILTGPGLWLHAFDARLLTAAVSGTIAEIHRSEPIDLIHAHFIYPEGATAARLSGDLGIPVVTTEHSHWIPWLTENASVRKQVLAAIPRIRVITGVSPSVCEGIRSVCGSGPRVEWLPNVLEDDVFTGPRRDELVDTNQLLFVGIVRRVKGLDVLVRALAILSDRYPLLRLRVMGEPFHRGYRRDEDVVRGLVKSLGLTNRIAFTGQASPTEVAAAMRTSALLVVPSRRESFSTVTVEALASGIPVVATRCGGPEHILDEAMGRLVPPDDPDALAVAIEDVLARRATMNRETLRRYAVDRFGLDASRRRLQALYADLIAGEPAS